jgi:putative ABC transport system permease protein
MLKNYFFIAARNLVQQRSRTLISLFSLIMGLTSFLLLMLYARHELSYDSFLKSGDRVYRLGQHVPT